MVNSKICVSSAPPRADNGILVDPIQTTDDIIEKVNESSPAFTVLASRCTTATQFSAGVLQVQSFAWAVPHLVKTADKTFADDNRGAIVELMRSGVSIKNLTKSEITIHANTPVARQHEPDKIYARLSGFRRKEGRKWIMSDDVHLGPNQTATYKVHWKLLPNEYTPMQMIKDGRVYMNLLCFGVEVKNINENTGAAYAPESEVVSLIPRVLYTKRQSNPQLNAGESLIVQSEVNFALQELSGFKDMYSVHPVSAMGGARGGDKTRLLPFLDPGKDLPIFDGTEITCAFIQDAVREGDLLGVKKVLVTRDKKSYNSCGLITKRVGGKERPLEMKTRQGGGSRLIVMGLNVASNPASAAVSFSYYKWDATVGYWILWDDFEQQPRYCPDNFPDFTPVSAGMPICYLDGVYTKKQKEEMLALMAADGISELG